MKPLTGCSVSTMVGAISLGRTMFSTNVIAAWVLGAFALTCSAMPAAADWQYTQWGMTPDQVKIASNGVARDNMNCELDATGVTAALVAPYQACRCPSPPCFSLVPITSCAA